MTATGGQRVLTAGESMALLDPATDGAISPGMSFVLRIAGAESNFGIALRRLGVPVTWVSRLGDDPLGDVLFGVLEREAIDMAYVKRDSAPTGLFFKWRSSGRSSVLYYRRGSAASRLEPGDVPDEALESARLVHLTGITMALSDSARRTVVDVARRARAAGALVLFDPNYRPTLWDSAGQAAEVQREVLPFVDWYLCGLQEGNLLWGTSEATGLFEALAEAGAERAVARVGTDGALVHEPGSTCGVAPNSLEQVLDEVGAGDAFAAGFAYGLLHGWAPEQCARAGNVIAARALLGTGDWETLPRLEEVEAALVPGPGAGRGR